MPAGPPPMIRTFLEDLGASGWALMMSGSVRGFWAQTPAGKLFLQTAREVLQELQDALTRCHSLSAGITGSLTVGIVRDYVDGNLVEVLDSF